MRAKHLSILSQYIALRTAKNVNPVHIVLFQQSLFVHRYIPRKGIAAYYRRTGSAVLFFLVSFEHQKLIGMIHSELEKSLVKSAPIYPLPACKLPIRVSNYMKYRVAMDSADSTNILSTRRAIERVKRGLVGTTPDGGA